MSTQGTGVCLMCLVSKPLKIVGKCKHVFCADCLHAELESKGGGVLSCPTCKVDCVCSSDGVKGLADFTGEEVGNEGHDEGDRAVQAGARDSTDVTGGDAAAEPNQGNRVEESGTGTGAECWMLDVRCKSCYLRTKDVLAVNNCIECGHLYMCGMCTKVHAQNKATRGHVVVPFRSEKMEHKAMQNCKTHDSLLNSYCLDCGKSVCMVCIMWDHGDHNVEKLGDLVDTKVKELNRALEERVKRFKRLKCLKYELMALKSNAPALDKKDLLIKEIEDHAEKCISQIVKLKEDFKKQVTADYKVMSEIPEDLEKVTEAIDELHRLIEKAKPLLASTEHRQEYLDKLISIQHDFDSVVDIGDDIKATEHWDELSQLHDYCFKGGEMATDFGKLDKTKPESDGLMIKEIFSRTVQTDLVDKFIPCVTNFGHKFAVAHPTRQGEPSEGIDVYEVPGTHGTLKQTLLHNVPPMYDMSATPAGKLAVLSDGTSNDKCSIKLFDLETGYISRTCDIDIAKPLSLGVTPQHQYVILGKNGQGETLIIVVDEEVCVESRYVIKKGTDKVKSPTRITCGGKSVFTADMIDGNDGSFAIFQIKDIRVQRIFTRGYKGRVTDMSATIWDNFFCAFIQKGDIKLSKWVWGKEENAKWSHESEVAVCKWHAEADKEARVSVKDRHIVISYGQTIKVYELQA